MPAEYEMPRRADHCVACQKPFAVGDEIHACLVTTVSGYDRRDYCTECDVTADPLIGSWRTRRREPKTRAIPGFDREATLEFFRRLSADTPEKRQLQFVLALLLWRKKALVFDTSRSSEEGEVWRFSTPKSEETFDVTRPELDEERMDQLGAQLETLLAGGEIAIEPTAVASAPDDTDV